MSLADELLADLEENEREDEEDEEESIKMEEPFEETEEKPDIKQLQMEIDTAQINSVRGMFY